jgi:serine/threonine-protein kinase
MAPEQIKTTTVDMRVDIYALGVTLWQFLTGILPFEGETPMAVLLNVVNEPLPMPEETFGALPRELREAIVAMTAKDPRRRLPNIPAVLAVLKKARDALLHAGLDSTAPLNSSGTRPPVGETRDPVSGASFAAPIPVPPKDAPPKRADPNTFSKPLGSEGAGKPAARPASARPGTAPPQRKPPTR